LTQRRKNNSPTSRSTLREPNGGDYTDVRIGRYLNQFITRGEAKVQNIVKRRIIRRRCEGDGQWHLGLRFNQPGSIPDGIESNGKAVAIAKANSKFQKEPVQLAATQSLWGSVVEDANKEERI